MEEDVGTDVAADDNETDVDAGNARRDLDFPEPEARFLFLDFAEATPCADTSLSSSNSSGRPVRKRPID